MAPHQGPRPSGSLTVPWVPTKPLSATGHNRRATGKVGVKATRIANAVLAKTGDEGKALRIANSYVAKKQGRSPGPHQARSARQIGARISGRRPPSPASYLQR